MKTWRDDIWPRIRFYLASAGGIVSLCLMASVYFTLMRFLRRWWPRSVYWWASRFMGTLRWLSGARVITTISDQVDLKAPYVFVSNHQSYLDIAVLMSSVPVWWRFVAMAPLRKVPFIGASMVDLGHIFIDRSTTEKAYESIDAAARRIRSGQSVILYPEGGLTQGGAIQPFKKGAFVLAIRTGVPIVPLIMRGSGDVLDVRARRSRSGAIHVDLLDPIPLDDWTDEADAQQLADEIRRRMVQAKSALETQEAPTLRKAG